MTLDQYVKWANEIDTQADLILKTQQYQRLCNVFIQDVWLDVGQPTVHAFLRSKADVMFELQGKLIK
jgi:hypothetical protein